MDMTIGRSTAGTRPGTTEHVSAPGAQLCMARAGTTNPMWAQAGMAGHGPTGSARALDGRGSLVGRSVSDQASCCRLPGPGLAPSPGTWAFPDFYLAYS
jgi:hypothetical protein